MKLSEVKQEGNSIAFIMDDKTEFFLMLESGDLISNLANKLNTLADDMLRPQNRANWAKPLRCEL